MSWFNLYCQTTGSNLNSGSTTSDTAAHTYASGTWVNSTRVFTVAAGDPAADGVNVDDVASVYVDGSTEAGFIGIVTARTSTTITISGTNSSGTNPADGTGNRTLKIGGAWAGPTTATTFPLAFVTTGIVGSVIGPHVRINMKTGTYDIRSTAAVSAEITVQGYTTTLEDSGRATLSGGSAGASFAVVNLNNARTHLRQVNITGNGATGTAVGVTMASFWSSVELCTITGTRGSGILANPGLAIGCDAIDCNASNDASSGGIFLANGNARRCFASGNLQRGFRVGTTSGTTSLTDCIADGNTGYGFQAGLHRGHQFLHRCFAYDNSSGGFYNENGSAQTGMWHLDCCIAENNLGWGYQTTQSDLNVWLNDCASYNNTSGHRSIAAVGNLIRRFQELTATAFVSGAAGDFNINNTSGGGAVLRALTQQVG